MDRYLENLDNLILTDYLEFRWYVRGEHCLTVQLSEIKNNKVHFTKEFSQKIKLKFIPDGQGDLNKTFGPKDIFHYIYSVFHSNAYRKRYA